MIKIQVKGAERVAAMLRKAVENVYDGARAGMYQGAMVVESKSKGLAPIDTSNLRASHFIFRKDHPAPTPKIINLPGVDVNKLREAFANTMAISSQQVRDKNTVRVGAAAFYALAVEFGNPAWNWKHGGPRYLRSARDSSTAEILRLAARGGANALRRSTK